MDERECANCGDEVLTLSSRDWCDGCEAEAGEPTVDELFDAFEQTLVRIADEHADLRAEILGEEEE